METTTTNEAAEAATGLAKMLAASGEDPSLGFEYIALVLEWNRVEAEFDAARATGQVDRAIQLARVLDIVQAVAMEKHAQIVPKIQTHVDAVTGTTRDGGLLA